MSSADLTCDFELDQCNWKGWSRKSMAGRNGEWSMVATQSSVLLSPVFPRDSFTKVVIFSYASHEGSTLELYYLSSSCRSCWVLVWTAPTGLGDVWRGAKVAIPAVAIALKFIAVGLQISHTVTIDNIVMTDMTSFQIFLQLSLGYEHTCIKQATEGQAICWGNNYFGQLGQGHQSNLGDGAGEMGDNLPPVSLGTGRLARQTAAGGYHTCALLDDETVKCWGANSDGQLGQAHTSNVGDGADEMGDNLPPVSLGTGHLARQIAAGGSHTCALLDDETVKCWGANSDGQLGQAHTSNVGDGADEMGDNLPPISLGTGRLARQIAAGGSHTCALLDDETVKCWGANSDGQLGQAHTSNVGDGADEMGDNLPPVSLGTGHLARQIAAGGSHTCALLDDETVKCWGANSDGQLGQAHTSNVGDGADEMGDNLPPVSLGTGRLARQIAAGGSHTCALLDDETVKCWGANSDGQLGQAHTSNVGDGADEMGDNLPPVSLGTGRSARQIAAVYHHTCALLDDDSVKCWGLNSFGELGLGHASNVGDGVGEMGDNLPAVALPAPNNIGSVQMRLSGSARHGRVEVLYDGLWGSVCGDGWSDANAKVVCKQINSAGGIAIPRLGGGSGRIWMHAVRCIGNESSLGNCAFRGLGVHNCSHAEDAGVECHLDAWTDFSVNSGEKPSQRAQHVSIWLDNEQAVLIFAGQMLDYSACSSCQVSTTYAGQAGHVVGPRQNVCKSKFRVA